uniref:Protein kinase domain-containing protein n=1 Tax=Macrostomum lignano TaxID=282301 RepID=A0A1I8JD51_9PLAT
MSGYCLITEHINCGSLRQFLHKQGERLLRDWEILISFGGQVANASAYLHRKGVVHNELVLDNCLLERSDRFTVKVSGLEFARFEDSSPRPLVHLMWRKYCRVAPLCPEIASGARQLPTCASDVWALGLLVWSLFSHGRQPSDCSAGAQPPPLMLSSPLLPKELTAALDHLIRSCLHSMPQLRISAVEIGKQLRSLIDFRSYLSAKYDQSFSSGVSSADLEPFGDHRSGGAGAFEISSSSSTTTPPPLQPADGGGGGGSPGGGALTRKSSRRLGFFRSKKWKSANLADQTGS